MIIILLFLGAYLRIVKTRQHVNDMSLNSPVNVLGLQKF